MQSVLGKLLYPLKDFLGADLESALKRHINPSHQRHIIPALSTDEFVAKLNERDIAYVALPRPPNTRAALELLVHDSDLDQLEDLVTDWPLGTPITMYSVSGRPGFKYVPREWPGNVYYRMSLFPAYFSEQLLERSGVNPGELRTLGPLDAFCSLAYRAAYLECSCWKRSDEESGWRASEAWVAELQKLAKAAGLTLPNPLAPAEMDQLLAAHEWRPSADLLERTSHWMPWIREAMPRAEPDQTVEPPGFTIFFIRERALQAGLKPEIVEALQDYGFEPLLVLDLDPSQREKAARTFRGGNWGAVSFPVSGGAPACIVVTLDLLPITPDEETRKRQPRCDNQKIVIVKELVRDLVNDELPPKKHYSAVHSTDNSGQAWRVVRLLIPNHEKALREQIEHRHGDFASDSVIRDLTRKGCRAKVELVDFQGQLAIRKTFRPTALAYMEREIEVIERLGPVRSEIPKLLGRGPNDIFLEYLGETKPLPRRRTGDRPRPLPLIIVRQLADFIKASVSQGFDPLDLRAKGNIGITPAGLKIIDFELWRRCDPATRPEKSFCLSGVPRGDRERPRASRHSREPYSKAWFPYTLLSVDSFLYDPPHLQRVKRAANLALLHASWAKGALARRGRRLAGRLMRRMLASRRPSSGSRHAASQRSIIGTPMAVDTK